MVITEVLIELEGVLIALAALKVLDNVVTEPRLPLPLPLTGQVLELTHVLVHGKLSGGRVRGGGVEDRGARVRGG